MERVRVPQTPSRTGRSWSLGCAVFLIALATAPLGAEESPADLGSRPAFGAPRGLRQVLAERLSREPSPSVSPLEDPVPVDYTNGWARALNDRGEVAGDAAGPGNRRGFFWSNGVAVDLGVDAPYVYDLNNRGQVVGYLENALYPPFLWEDGVLRILQTTTEMPYGIASAINDHGQVAGVIGNSLVQQAATWVDGVLHLLPVPDVRLSEATGINDHGLVIGWSMVANGSIHAVVWENGAVTDLFPGSDRNSHAISVNDRGQVMGMMNVGGPNPHGFIWERGSLTEIAPLGCYTFAMNNRGQVVGGWGADGPFLWDRGVMTSFRFPEEVSGGRPVAINDQGQVVMVLGMRDSGRPHVAVWDRGNLTYIPATSEGAGETNLAINKHGQVMGSTHSRQRPYLWDHGTMIYLLEGTVAANLDVEEGTLNTRKGSASDPLAVRVLSQGSWAGTMELSLSLNRAGEVAVSLYDVTGRLLASRAPEHLGAGESTLRWEPGVRESGLYFARVRTEAGAVTRKWTVVR
jgi:probable HAF family extracellular repeat protein